MSHKSQLDALKQLRQILSRREDLPEDVLRASGLQQLHLEKIQHHNAAQSSGLTIKDVEKAIETLKHTISQEVKMSSHQKMEEEANAMGISLEEYKGTKKKGVKRHRVSDHKIHDTILKEKRDKKELFLQVSRGDFDLYTEY